MARLSDLELAKAFVASATPSFADIIARLEAVGDLTPSRRRDLISGLRRVAAAIRWRTEDVPADPVWLRPRIAKVMPAALGMSAKTWTNTVSNARSALAAAGIVERDRGTRLPLTGDWHALWARALASRDRAITIPLTRFVRFASTMGVSPAAITDDVLADYRRALELGEIRKDPDSATWQAAHAWNRACDRIEGWPEQRLTKPARHNRFALALDDFPPSLREDLDALEARLRCADVQDPDGRVAELADDSIAHRRRQIVRFASALVHDGIPASEIVSLSELLPIDRVQRGLQWLATNRHGGKTSAGLHQTALALCMLGRELKIESDHLAELRRITARLGRTKRKGMTEKNAGRLRHLRDREVQLALLNLPSVLVAKAAREERQVKAARLVEAAVAIGLVCVCPVRLKNLAAIEVGRHFDRTQRGRLYFVVPGAEVKNGRSLEFELPQRLIGLVDRFLEEHRKHLVSGSCPWLFAREDGRGPVHKTVLARRITETIGQELGLEMNPHLFRHLAAMIILERDPGGYDLVRRLLGHSELSTTLDAYSGVETLRATQWFGELVEESQSEAPVRKRRKPQ